MTKEDIIKLTAKAEDVGITHAISSLLGYMSENNKIALTTLEISKVGLECLKDVGKKYNLPIADISEIQKVHDKYNPHE